MTTDNVAEWYKTEYTHACQGLAQARAELQDLRSANRALARQLDDVTSSCDFWYKEAHDDEAERDKAQTLLAAAQKATDWLWGYWDGNTLVPKPGYEDDIRKAWGDLLVAVDPADNAILERLATLDAAEAALANCDIGGILAEFDGLADAIQQMSEYIKKLSEEHDQLVDRVEDAMGQIEKYDECTAENLIQYAVGDILERLKEAEQELKQAQADLDAEPVEVEITGKEMVQALQAERQLRQEAQEYVDDCRSVLTGVRKILDECQVEGKYDAPAVMRIRWLYQRAEQYAESLGEERDAVHEALDECQIPRNYDDGEPASTRTRIFWLNAERTEELEREIKQHIIALSTTSTGAAKLRQRAKTAEARISHLSQVLNTEVKLRRKAEARAEALAQLVTEETAALLIRLSSNAHARADIATDPSTSWVSRCRKDAWAGRDFAARIREALALEGQEEGK